VGVAIMNRLTFQLFFVSCDATPLKTVGTGHTVMIGTTTAVTPLIDRMSREWASRLPHRPTVGFQQHQSQAVHPKGLLLMTTVSV
jgi:hypothetical protein